MKNRLTDILKIVIFLGIGLFFVYWFLLKLDADTKSAIWESITQANYGWIGVAMGINFFALFIRALRWQLLYEPLGLHPKLNSTFGSVMVAYLANLAIPRLGEVLRCATMRTSEKVPIEKSLGTVVTERAVDVTAYFLILAIGVVVMFADMKNWFGEGLAEKFSNWQALVIILGVIAGIGIAAVWIYVKMRQRLIKHPIIKKVDKILVGCKDGVVSVFHLRRKSAMKFVLYSVLIYLCYMLGSMVTFYAFEETMHLGFKEAFVVYIFGSVGMVISQGGIGAYPTLVQKALALYGISLATGTACGWLMWSNSQIIIIVVGLIYMVYFSLRKKSNTATE